MQCECNIHNTYTLIESELFEKKNYYTLDQIQCYLKGLLGSRKALLFLKKKKIWTFNLKLEIG